RRKHSLCREPWCEDRSRQRQERGGRNGQSRPRKSHHPGDLRTLRAHRLAEIPLSQCHSAILTGCSRRRCSYRDARGSLMGEHTRILVVDDETQITRVLRTSFSAQGYDLRVANDGEMALEIMKDWSPNLIITDLAMPNLNGVELCRRVRAVSEIP